MFTQRIFNMIDEKEKTFATIVFLFLIVAVVIDLALDGFAMLEVEEVVIELLIILLSLAGLSALNLSVLHKGKRLKIAKIRGTKSATVRNQAHKIYDKSELVGRHELGAYFLEELFQ